MDKHNDLVLGVLGTMWERTRPLGVKTYLESIKRSGFSGRKVMLCWDIHPETRNMLLEYGFELVDLPVPTEPFFHARMRVCWEYLRDHGKEFRYIFWLDVKDLVLQNDPSVWMESNIGESKLIASSECVSIENEETNKMWAENILGESRYQELKDELVINGGTWAGTSDVMTEVFHQVHLGCETYSGGYPPCQIWINYVMRQSPFKEVLRIPKWSEGFSACLHPCWSPWRVPCWPHMKDPHPVLGAKDCILYSGTSPDPNNPMIVFNPLWGNNPQVHIADRRIIVQQPSDPLKGIECSDNPKGRPFSIVHGYDRDWDMKLLFEYKYNVNHGVTLESYKKYNEEMAKNLPAVRVLRLRREKNEGPTGVSKLPQQRRFLRRH